MKEITKEDQFPSNVPPRRKRAKIKNLGVTVIYYVVVAIMLAIAVRLFGGIVGKGAEALTDSFNASLASEREAAYQEQYQKYYDAAEAANHVRNRGSIYIGDIAETDKLEVLKVSDVEFVVDDSDDNAENVTSWLEVPGEGTYVVDLRAAEFIVDNERSSVLVRLPYPELTNISIDYSNVKKILFKDTLK